MKVVIVIPVFNRATIIPDTLESVVAQSVQPSQVVVVDDGSTDDSPAAAERWFQREPRSFGWKVVRARHVSGGTARNRGAREADSSELLQFLDSDDILPPDFLERAIAVFRANPNVEIASADQVYTGPRGEVNHSRSLEGIAENASRWFGFNDAGVLSTTVMRSAVFRRFGPFPENLPYGEDAHVLYPASRKVVWGYIPGAPVNYRQLGDNLSRPSPERAMAWMNKAERATLELGLTKRERTWTLSRRWVRTGRLMRDCGRYAEARDCYRRAIQHRPLFAAAYRRLLEELLRRS